MLLARGADPTAGNVFSSTPLHQASRNGKLGLECLELLLQQPAVRANMDVQDSWGDTPVVVACKRSGSKALKMLLDAGASPNFLDAGDISPLEHAYASEKKDRIEVLQRACTPRGRTCVGARGRRRAHVCACVRLRACARASHAPSC
jgi:ankyrin repeat protein